MRDKKKKKDIIKLRDLKPTKDAKGGRQTPNLPPDPCRRPPG
jgi:hypothetical protein